MGNSPGLYLLCKCKQLPLKKKEISLNKRLNFCNSAVDEFSVLPERRKILSLLGKQSEKLIEFIIEGVITGLVLSIMIGPVFFVLLETSIRKGIRSALTFDAGVLISDVVYILIAYYFYSEVASLKHGENNEIAKVVGGFLFLSYGIYSYFKKQKKIVVDEDGNIVQQDFWKLFFKGFILNFLNPMVIFYWFSILTIHGREGQIPFVSIVLITYFSIDILKILGAKKLRPLVTDNRLKLLNYLIALIFLVFGVYLIVKGFFFA